MEKENTKYSWLLAFSLATLSFLQIWVLKFSCHWYYDLPCFHLDPGSMVISWLLMLPWMILLAVMFYLSSHRIVRIFLASCFVFFILTALAILFFQHFSLFNRIITAVIISASVFLLFPKEWQVYFWRFLRISLLILSPFAFFISAAVVWMIVNTFVYPPSEEATPPQPYHANLNDQAISHPRVIWMVFDEMDIRLAFEHPEARPLPHLARLRAESLYASQAYAASHSTMLAVPSMISGRIFGEATILNDRNVSFSHMIADQESSWENMPNILSEMQQQGLRTAILGNFHPYHRIYSGKIDYVLQSCKAGYTSWDHLMTYAQMVLGQDYSEKFSFFHPAISYENLMDVHESVLSAVRRQAYIKSYQLMYGQAKEVCCNSAYDFIFIHWTIPHYPGIYNGEAKKLDVDYPANYFDNLMLVDDTLGELREHLEKANLWDSTTLIVTSDHWLQPFNLEEDICCDLSSRIKKMISQADYRVPFLMKLANERSSVDYTGKFRLNCLHDLIVNVFNRKIETHEQLADWLGTQEQFFTLEGMPSQ